MEQAVGMPQAGRMAEAIDIYNKVLAVVPNHFDATHLLGVIALQEGRLDQAQELIASALRTNHLDSSALNNLGLVYLRKGELELARGQFERAIKVKPDLPDAL